MCSQTVMLLGFLLELYHIYKLNEESTSLQYQVTVKNTVCISVYPSLLLCPSVMLWSWSHTGTTRFLFTSFLSVLYFGFCQMEFFLTQYCWDNRIAIILFPSYLLNSVINLSNFSIDPSRFPECGGLHYVKLIKQELCFPESSFLYYSELELTKRGLQAIFGSGSEAAAITL